MTSFFYCDSSNLLNYVRGGVLEAAGAASIKFRERDVITTAHRIDPQLRSLDLELSKLRSSGTDASEIEKEIKRRERMLLGVYQQIAVHFADLHDTPGRMKAKGVIKAQVKWAESRAFFFWRLKRRILEFEHAQVTRARSRQEAIDRLKAWFMRVDGNEAVWNDDKKMVGWFEDHQSMLLSYEADIKEEFLSQELTASLSDISSSASISGVFKKALEGLSAESRSKLLTAIKEL